MDLRHFLTLGMLSSGLMSVFFGLGYFWKFHNFAYFVTIQVIIMQQILYADNKLLQYMLEFICDHKRLPQQKNKQLCD